MLDLGKALVKRVAHNLLGDYSAYYVYASPNESKTSQRYESKSKFSVRTVDEHALQSSAEPLLREQAHYLGQESHAYACLFDDRIAGVCIYWFGERYRKRNFWPLKEGEAKLVQIVSVSEMRGRGVATALIATSCCDMKERGFRRTYARIWHSNTASLRAFERAGWMRVALVLEINPLHRQRPIRVRFDLRS